MECSAFILDLQLQRPVPSLRGGFLQQCFQSVRGMFVSLAASSERSMIRLVIADDHAVVRKGLRQIISETVDLSVTGEAASGDELLTLLRSRSFDVVVLDLTLGERDGI